MWIAAHLERKVKKTQIDGINIPSYAECIMAPEVPIALRLSGHLLLGLVRIYSWQVNYLFQDCNRMLSAVRTAFASVEVDLPFDADRAPFELITMPETFNLDHLNLDDAIRQMETPDNHRRTSDQITLSEEEYVTISLDEDGRIEPSPAGRSLDFETEPPEQGTFPPFPDDAMSLDPVQDNLPPNPTNGEQDSPERPREAPESPLSFRGVIDGNDSMERPREAPESPLSFKGVIDGNDPMEEDLSPFIYKVTTPPAKDPSLSPGRGSLLGASIHNVPRSIRHDPIEDEEPGDTGISVPEFRLEPSPPQVQDNKRKRIPKVQAPKFDDEIVLSNAYMKKQIDGDDLCKLVCKRKKLPHTAVDMWKFNRIRRKDSFLCEPLVHGMCLDLHKTYEREFSRLSDSDSGPASENRATGDANVGDENAPPECQLTPKSLGNADTQSEQLSPKSSGNIDAHLEPQLTPMSPGNADATPSDYAPELPRFSPQNTPQTNLSPVREDHATPFKTPGRTPQSGFGGTGASEIPPTYGTSASPGQRTYESDPNGSPFPFNDELDEDLPEIPGLINTPSTKSSAGTGATGLGSMSARTRAVAQYFKDKMSSATSNDQPGKFSLNSILEGRRRKQAARMFFETLALKSYDYIDVQQEEAYSDITISVRPSLSAAKL